MNISIFSKEHHFSPERVELLQLLAQKPDVYDRLSRAIAPSIYENEDVKKGILLQLFGGTKKTFVASGRTNFRSEINILLCGDPGKKIDLNANFSNTIDNFYRYIKITTFTIHL